MSVDEPSQAFIDAFLNAPPLERPKQQDSDPVSYEAEPQTDPGEILFALGVLVNDLNRNRCRIQWIWSNHRDGYFDLAAPAVATNVTVSLARGLIEDVEPLLSRFEGGGWRAVSTFCSMCLAKRYAVDAIYLDGSKDNFNYDLYEVANSTYLGAYRMLISFMDVLDPKRVPWIKDGIFGHYDPESDRSTKTGAEKFQEDKIRPMEWKMSSGGA